MLLVPNGMRLEWRNEMSRFLASTAGAADSRRSFRGAKGTVRSQSERQETVPPFGARGVEASQSVPAAALGRSWLEGQWQPWLESESQLIAEMTYS